MVYVRACPESKEPSISPNPVLPNHTRKLAHSFSKNSCSQTPDSTVKHVKTWIVAVVLVDKSYLTLCDLVNCSPPGSSVHGDSPATNTGVRYYFFSRVSS